jgi:hypothetical protein
MDAADPGGGEMPPFLSFLQYGGERLNLLFFKDNCPILNSLLNMNSRTSHFSLLVVLYSYIDLID